MDNDPTLAAQFTTFLGEYSRALAVGNRQFLTDHTHFPLPFAEANYDMEAKAHSGKLSSVAALLKARQRLRWPAVLVPKTPEDLGRLRRGGEKCSDAKAPEVPDWQQGEPAIELHGDHATLTYIAEPCESETHMVTLSFVRTEKTWRLQERTVRLGST